MGQLAKYSRQEVRSMLARSRRAEDVRKKEGEKTARVVAKQVRAEKIERLSRGRSQERQTALPSKEQAYLKMLSRLLSSPKGRRELPHRKPSPRLSGRSLALVKQQEELPKNQLPDYNQRENR